MGAVKAAEICAAGALAHEFGSYRIRVNALYPGSILFEGGDWDRLREKEPERFAAFEREEFPCGRLEASGGGGGRRRLPTLGARLVDKRSGRPRRRGPGRRLDHPAGSTLPPEARPCHARAGVPRPRGRRINLTGANPLLRTEDRP